MEITAGIHLLQATKGSYAYLVLLEEPVLIDTSFPGRATAILTELEKLGLRPTDLAHILLTHQDGDHIGNAYTLQHASGARVWASQEDLPYILHQPHPSGVSVGKTINSPLLTHKIARSLSLIRIFVLLLLTHIFARI